MTPAARIAAAIDISDIILSGEPAEKTLTKWARGNRYAGSGDRAAIRDLVFTGLRCRRSFAHLGGSMTGRGLMIGQARALGQDLSLLFSGVKYAPAPLDLDEEQVPDMSALSDAVRFDCPDWLLPMFENSLGSDTSAILESLQSRAPVFLRVNSARTDRATVAGMLAESGIVTCEHGLAPTALEVLENPRRVAASDAYLQGLVELQDAAAQAIVDMLPVDVNSDVLDFCAGGGGKSLAIAAKGVGSVTAYDALPQRMQDLPNRIARAGAKIDMAEIADLSGRKFDLVVCDVPCSGSGSWRRTPDSKWTLTTDRLAELVALQSDILDESQGFVRDAGALAYITCSMFNAENRDQIDHFLGRHSGWRMHSDHRLTPLSGGDGFYLALLTRV